MSKILRAFLILLGLGFMLGFIVFMVSRPHKHVVQIANKTTAPLSISKTAQGKMKAQLIGTVQPSATSSFKLIDGNYTATMTDSQNTYASNTIEFVVAPQTNTTQLDADFSDTFLATMVAKEQPAIMKAIDQQLPGWQNTYAINGVHLYVHGDWAGVVFKAKNPTKYDDLRTILGKTKEGTWSVVVSPPQIVIGKPSHPTIPPKVIEAIDSLDQ